MKTLDKDLGGFIVECRGAWPEGAGDGVRLGVLAASYFKSEFQQRAKELGFVNGYRWGVEHPTNGKRPHIPSEVFVQPSISGINWMQCSHKVSDIDWGAADSFKISDVRYKPADTSYLETPAKEPVEVDDGWYDYDKQKALRLPPVGVECEWLPPKPTKSNWKRCTIDFIHGEIICVTNKSSHKEKQAVRNVLFRPLDHDRKQQAKRKAFVDAAVKASANANVYEGYRKLVAEALFDAGFKAPEQE